MIQYRFSDDYIKYFWWWKYNVNDLINLLFVSTKLYFTLNIFTNNNEIFIYALHETIIISRIQIPITVRFAMEFRVGAPWKSTRHRYKPLSAITTFLILRKLLRLLLFGTINLPSFPWTLVLGPFMAIWKDARPPKTWLSVQWRAASGPLPRRS